MDNSIIAMIHPRFKQSVIVVPIHSSKVSATSFPIHMFCISACGATESHPMNTAMTSPHILAPSSRHNFRNCSETNLAMGHEDTVHREMTTSHSAKSACNLGASTASGTQLEVVGPGASQSSSLVQLTRSWRSELMLPMVKLGQGNDPTGAVHGHWNKIW